MRAENYADTVFGAPTREPGNQWAFDYYLPRPIPRDLPMSPRLVTALSEADAALSRLDALSGAVDDPDVLAAPFLRREAVASTRLDGVRVSLAEVWQAGLDDRAYTQDVLAVQRYVEAAELACDLARELPITQRLILDVHRALLRDVVPEERRPGELRTSPVWIGAAEATPDTADFVTPLPVHLPDLLTDWERFVNDDGLDYPPLVQAALMHYQFATLHPFIDGNGRLGRLLITLLLVARGRLTHPLLDLSTALEARGQEYYLDLQAVRESGDIDGWLFFFLEAVREQAEDAAVRARALLELREELRSQAGDTRESLVRLVDVIVRDASVTVRSVATALGLEDPDAHDLVDSAVDMGWLTSLGPRGLEGHEHWHAPRIDAVLGVSQTFHWFS